MGGAYVGKPDADTSPVVPPGWWPGWPFPPPGTLSLDTLGTHGPFPPGYEAEYSLSVTGASEVVAKEDETEEYVVTIAVYDHEEYETSPITGEITLTASIMGNNIGLKEPGGAFSNSLVVDSGGTTLIFDANEDLVGLSVVLSAECDPFEIGETMSGSKVIELVVPAPILVTIRFEVIAWSYGANNLDRVRMILGTVRDYGAQDLCNVWGVKAALPEPRLEKWCGDEAHLVDEIESTPIPAGGCTFDVDTAKRITMTCIPTEEAGIYNVRFGFNVTNLSVLTAEGEVDAIVE